MWAIFQIFYNIILYLNHKCVNYLVLYHSNLNKIKNISKKPNKKTFFMSNVFSFGAFESTLQIGYEISEKFLYATETHNKWIFKTTNEHYFIKKTLRWRLLLSAKQYSCWKDFKLIHIIVMQVPHTLCLCFLSFLPAKTFTAIHMWPWTTKPVISSTGIFVAIANNTLYGSKL